MVDSFNRKSKTAGIFETLKHTYIIFFISVSIMYLQIEHIYLH